MERMEQTDTSPESQAFVNRLYQQMPEGEKLLRVFYAFQTGKSLALAGLSMRYPQATEDQLQWLWKRQYLGEKLFTEVYGNHPEIPN